MELNKIIDAHVMLGEEEYLRLKSRELLKRMDKYGIESAIARPMGTELVYSFSKGNKRLLKLDPRIKIMATANPWAGAKALTELERSHAAGAVGLYLHPSRQGFMPTETVVAPLLEKAISLKFPIMFHTGSYTYSDLTGVGELCKRYPEGKFIAGFGGFSDMWFDLPQCLIDNQNLYLETSMNWCFAIEGLIKVGLQNRMMFASAAPRNNYAVVMKIWGLTNATDEQRRLIFYENAKKLFNL